ncbi:hypothetical protein M0R72_10440 [Candidatus Pacearchaeota archaeon]|jgi:hypothetical protein|nr:hypothetical protein [Candidatus Pacearchaeota archaeon]
MTESSAQPVNQQPTENATVGSEVFQQLREKFTPTQIVLLRILNDGLPHLRNELTCALMTPDDTSRVNLNNHISDIRKKLRPMGHDIICELWNRRIAYRHVRLLASATNGYH